MTNDTAKSGVTQEMLINWGGPAIFNIGLRIVNSGEVPEFDYDPATRTVTGKITQPDGWDMPLSFVIEKNGCVTSHCPCRANREHGQICEHVLALGIALMVREMDEEEGEGQGEGEGEGQEAKVDEEEFIEVPIAPQFNAYIRGSRASLSIELDAYYGPNGEVSFPACSTQAARVVWFADPDDPLVRRVRSMKTEQEAVAALEKAGFHKSFVQGDLKLFITDTRQVLNFLGTGPAELRRRGWSVEIDPQLERTMDAMATVVPVVKIRDAGGGAFDVSYCFDAQGADVPAALVQAALNRGDSFLKDGDRITLLDSSAIAAMHDVFRDCAGRASGSADGSFRIAAIHAPYVKAALDRLSETVELEDDEAEEWRARTAFQNRDAKFEPIALGALDQVLRPYQKQGVYWMRFMENAGMCGLLADEMGLGKTLQTLTWLSLPRVNLRPSTSNLQPSLIVCPTSLVRNWEAESAKFTPNLKTLVISGPDRAKDFKRIGAADIVITSYALLQRDLDVAYRDREFSAVVLDEAQHIKNRGTRNAKAAKELRAMRRLVLTGTPVENSVADVWSIFDFLMPGYLGDYETFKFHYETPVAEGGAAGELAQEKLKMKLHPFILRRLKKSVAKDLPDKLVKVSYCPMPAEIQAEYNDVLQRGRPGAKTKFEMLALLMKLRQIASRGKIESFMDTLDEAIDGGHRVLVFSQFVKQLTELRKELEKNGIPYAYLDGGTKDRLGECNRFNRDKSIPVFLISLMAGGTGLNLTGADMVIHYDPWWNPAVEDQATDRAHRIGQKKQVYVVKLIASGSVEEKVLALQRRKQAVIAATVSTSDAAIVERLTAEDLAELLK